MTIPAWVLSFIQNKTRIYEKNTCVLLNVFICVHNWTLYNRCKNVSVNPIYCCALRLDWLFLLRHLRLDLDTATRKTGSGELVSVVRPAFWQDWLSVTNLSCRERGVFWSEVHLRRFVFFLRDSACAFLSHWGRERCYDHVDGNRSSLLRHNFFCFRNISKGHFWMN